MIGWRSSEALDLLAPDDKLVLSEAALEGASIIPPPPAVERLGHHLVDDDIVPLRRAFRFLPEPLRRRARVRREPAEVLRQLAADSGIVRGRKGAAGSVVERQEQLDEMNGASTSRSEEHTSELQSPAQLVCRLLL